MQREELGQSAMKRAKGGQVPKRYLEKKPQNKTLQIDREFHSQIVGLLIICVVLFASVEI